MALVTQRKSRRFLISKSKVRSLLGAQMKMVNLKYNNKLATANPALKTAVKGTARSAALGRAVMPVVERVILRFMAQ